MGSYDSKNTKKQTLPSLGKREIQKSWCQKNILVYTRVHTEIYILAFIHTHIYIILQQHMGIIYKGIFKSDDVVTLNPSLTGYQLKAHLKI